MNIKTNATRVLCYGDSNTWGFIPGSGERYPVNVRWTGILQAKLGDGYEIIEEGLSGRTTILDDPDVNRIGKNGKTYLTPCLESQNPIDILILMLGTNDAKVKFNRTPQQIIDGLEELVGIIKEYAKDRDGQTPQVIIISPPHVNENVEGTQDKYKGGQAKIEALAEGYKKIAEVNSFRFVDIAAYVEPSIKDGLHLEPEAHKKIAEVLAEEILTKN